MTRTTISLQNVTIRFPTTRVTLKSIGRSVLSLVMPSARREPYYTALDDVSIEISNGEVVGLIGHNGAGKSTLLRVMAGIYRPDNGTARTAGRTLLLAGLGVGFNVNLSGRENVYLYGSILGHRRKTMDRLMEGIIEFSELGEFIEQPLRTYSNGMRARLGFSVASAVRPDILLIDEVLAVGDADFKERSKARLREMVDEAGTVVMASHSLLMLSELCNRLVLVEKAKIKAIGEPDEVIKLYRGEAAAADLRRSAG